VLVLVQAPVHGAIINASCCSTSISCPWQIQMQRHKKFIGEHKIDQSKIAVQQQAPFAVTCLGRAADGGPNAATGTSCKLTAQDSTHLIVQSHAGLPSLQPG